MFWTIFVILTLSQSPELQRRVCAGEESPLFLEIPRGIEPARNDKKGGEPSASPQGDK